MLYLASTSPRRHRLLAVAGIDFTPVAPGVEPEGHGGPAERARLRARGKAEGAVPGGPDGWVLGCDTVVACGDLELGKPPDPDAARRMLNLLSGREHEVFSGLCLVSHPPGAHFERLARARVRCRYLSPARLDAYLAGGHWRGKAGGYGIQDRECDFMELIEGALDTVIGLPVTVVEEMLAAARAEASGR